MTVAESSQYIGTEWLINIDGFEIPVVLKDLKVSYGRTLALVEPTARPQTGQWIVFDRLSQV